MVSKYKIFIPNMLKDESARKYYENQMREFLDKKGQLTPAEIERARNTFYRDALDIQNSYHSISKDLLLSEE